MSGEPLRTNTFTLTTADALAYEHAAYRFRPLGFILFLVWLAAVGSAVLLVPVAWRGPPDMLGFWVLAAIFVAIAYVLAMVLPSFRAWRRARKRLRRPIEVTLEEWPDRIGLSGHGIPHNFAHDAIESRILTRAHLFLRMGDEVLIVPRRAFPEEGTFEALLQRLDNPPATREVDPAPVTA
jgi:lysylphosphatidylglycerol synthetase-like protein (DUF2156 family)